MTEIAKLPVAQLRLVISDAQELAKGTALADKSALSHLARHDNKLYADAEGSGKNPYKAQVVQDDKGYRGRCSCMAARTRPFCKHAAALLVQWARDPAAFAVAEAAPAPAAGTAKAKRSKPRAGKTDTKALMEQGVEQTLALVRELSLAGISTIDAARVEQIRALAETLRSEKLRRMSSRMLELAQTLDVAVIDYARLDCEAYAAALSDLWLSARRVGKHLAGTDPLQPQYVESLIGKNWSKKDRLPVADLDLLEYAFLHQITADDFVIRESRFVDLASGTHYSDKQILPAFLAKRTAPKPSYEGFVLRNAGGGRYPTFAPYRLDLAEPGTAVAPDPHAFDRLQAHALSDVSAALASLLEARKDIFGADSVPVSVRIESLFADGERLFAVDANDDSLLIAGGAATVVALTNALLSAQLKLILGDLLLIGAMPCLSPLAVLVERNGELTLIPLPAVNSETLLLQRKRKQATAPRRERWIDSAREMGVGAAALVLGEAREELADVLGEGLSALNTRRAAGVVERLQSLKLVKPAALLAALAERDEPADKLDDLIRIMQVLGIGLTRLAASRKIDRQQLVQSPVHPAIEVYSPDVKLDADQLVAELGAGRLHGHSRAIAIDTALATFDAATLESLAATLFSDGSVVSLVAKRYAEHPQLALRLAEQILNDERRRPRAGYYYDWSAQARVAKLAAMRVLQAVGGADAQKLLREYHQLRRVDGTLKALAAQILDPSTRRQLPADLVDGLSAANREDRSDTLRKIGEHGILGLLPRVRLLADSDPSVKVRYAAWSSMALLLDVDAVPMLVGHIQHRDRDEDAAREAVYALAHLGDSRGIGPLLDAFSASFKPGIIGEGLESMGIAVIAPLLARIDAEPHLAERKVAQNLVASIDSDRAFDILSQRLAAKPTGEFADAAKRGLKLTGDQAALKLRLALWIEEHLTGFDEEYKLPGDLKRALGRAKAPPKKKA